MGGVKGAGKKSVQEKENNGIRENKDKKTREKEKEKRIGDT